MITIWQTIRPIAGLLLIASWCLATPAAQAPDPSETAVPTIAQSDSNDVDAALLADVRAQIRAARHISRREAKRAAFEAAIPAAEHEDPIKD